MTNPLALHTLLWRYALFAVVATLANLSSQRIVLGISDSSTGFALAITVGTAVGLVVKYILDKRWIFADMSTGAKAHGKRFGLYTVMGVLTTAIFWSTETAFWLHFHTDAMREFGAILGLGVGYIVKYQLDKRFVFTLPQQGGQV